MKRGDKKTKIIKINKTSKRTTWNTTSNAMSTLVPTCSFKLLSFIRSSVYFTDCFTTPFAFLLTQQFK